MEILKKIANFFRRLRHLGAYEAKIISLENEVKELESKNTEYQIKAEELDKKFETLSSVLQTYSVDNQKIAELYDLVFEKESKTSK